MSRVIRNKALIRHLIKAGIVKNQKDLGERMGYSNASSFSQVINEKVPEPKDFIPKLINILPELNEEWLTTGKGEMITMPATMTDSIPSPEKRQDTGVGVDMSVVPAEIIEEIKAEVVAESAIPVISPDVANKPNLDVREYIKENIGELEHINPGELLQRADCAERILKTSMLPTFIPGDIVFVRFLRDKAKIVDGDTYYFDLNTRPTMIRKVKINGDKLRLVAQNPEYGDVIIDRSDILNVAEIVGLLRMTFSDQYFEMESLRRKKEAQIDNLIEEIGKAGSRTDRLMEQNIELMKQVLKK